MNYIDLILIALVLIAVGLAIRKIISNAKSGKCSGCSSCGNCSKCKDNIKDSPLR